MTQHHPHHTAANAKRINECGRFISVDILRMGTDCTNDGISSPDMAMGRTFFAPCPDGPWTFDELVDRPKTVILVVNNSRLGDGHSFTFKVAGEHRHSMMGGNWIYTCDSRFVKCYGGPIPLHDRHE